MIGWGVTDSDPIFGSTVLQKVTVPVISDADCKQYHGEDVFPSMICAGGQQGSCQAKLLSFNSIIANFIKNNKKHGIFILLIVEPIQVNSTKEEGRLLNCVHCVYISMLLEISLLTLSMGVGLNISSFH